MLPNKPMVGEVYKIKDGETNIPLKIKEGKLTLKQVYKLKSEDLKNIRIEEKILKVFNLEKWHKP